MIFFKCNYYYSSLYFQQNPPNRGKKILRPSKSKPNSSKDTDNENTINDQSDTDNVNDIMDQSDKNQSDGH